MANAKIQWTQKVAGRDEGDIEVVEIDTPFMKGCLANRRYVVLESYAPAPTKETVQVEKPKPSPRPNRSETRTKPEEGDGGVEAQGRTWV